MVAVSTVSPGETMNWAGQKAGARQGLMSSKAQNLYQQQLSGLDLAKNLRNHSNQWNQTRMGISTPFAQQGTLQSGLYKNALQQYGRDRMNAYTDIQQGHQVQQGQFSLNDRGYEDDYASQLMRILGEQYARQATQASGIGSWI